MILAADVGGTKTILGLFRAAGERLRVEREETFSSREYSALEAMVGEFLGRGRERVERAAIGVAGPVIGGRSQVVNLRWPVDARRLAKKIQLAASRVQVLNDVEANAWGIPQLTSRKLANLTPGLRARRGNAALIAAGTGLGMALLHWDGERYRVAPSEGGHQDFGPRDDLEIALLHFMRRRHGRVSVERLVAGPGFLALYQFLLEVEGGTESPEMSRRLAEAEDPNALISRSGMAAENPLAERAVDLFVSLYGSAAGNLALVGKAVGGVYLGGGIAPRILPKLRSGDFLRSFRNKGRLTPLLEAIPVRVILEPRTALIGAAACAARAGRTARSGRVRTRSHPHKKKR